MYPLDQHIGAGTDSGQRTDDCLARRIANDLLRALRAILGLGLGEFAGRESEHGAIAAPVDVLRIFQQAVYGYDEHTNVCRALTSHRRLAAVTRALNDVDLATRRNRDNAITFYRAAC